MVCQEYPRLVVTPALDASVEQFLAAGLRAETARSVPGASTVVTSTWNRMTGIYSLRRARRATVQN